MSSLGSPFPPYPRLISIVSFFRLGAGKFYVFDNNSTTPMVGNLLDYIEEGLVEYQFVTHFRFALPPP